MKLPVEQQQQKILRHWKKPKWSQFVDVVVGAVISIVLIYPATDLLP